jgi:hypothetical protein
MNKSFIYVSVIKVINDGSIGYNFEYIKNNTIIQPENIKKIKPKFVCKGECNTCKDKQCYEL